ncbi:MAG: hypothetical protein QE265_03020 [Rhodoferax sp.]|nr:hypothetical protein [Rhodoferax sp.]
MRRLLNFLLNKRVSGDVRGVSEYAIGMEVFDRKPEDYSTSEDPIARVQMGRLRGRLRAYYASLATPADLEISIPLGSYMPVIRRQGRTEVAAAYANKLRVDDIKCIAQCADGVHFTQGLQEELVHQLFRVLGAGVTLQAPSLGTASLCAPPPTGGAIAHRLEGSVRIDEERIRTSVRLVEVSKGHVAWSSQFDRNIFFAIAHQEELALSICSELKRFLLPAIA